jgi:hypothetical protein
MYLQKVISRKTLKKKSFLLASWRSVTKIAGSGSISQNSEAWTRGSGSISNCHGSATLVLGNKKADEGGMEKGEEF